MSVHIEGLGLLGSLTALTLYDMGIDFSWHDTEEEVQAWKASTGAVYPTGDEFDYRCFKEMIRIIKRRNTLMGKMLRQHGEVGRWCYTSTNPPHGGSDIGMESIAELADISVSNRYSIHMNNQKLVEAARTYFKDQRTEESDECATVQLVSHGFDDAVRFGWGWHTRVYAEISDELMEHTSGHRPCIYLREGYQVMYLYPCPTTDLYYLGTSNNIANEPKVRDEPYIIERLEKVHEHLRRKCGTHVQLMGSAGKPTQGWRPYPAKGDEGPRVRVDDNGVVRIKPQKGSGLRHWPATQEELVSTLLNHPMKKEL